MRGAHRRRGFNVALGALLTASCAFALNPALDVSQYAHTPWRSSDGFVRGIIETIAQTPDGYLWLGTEFGALRFDGVRTLPPPDPHFPTATINRLLVTHDGTLWIASRQGLASWRAGKLVQYPELAGQIVDSLLEDQEGTLWAGVYGIPTGKLCAIQANSIQCYGEDGRFGPTVLSLHEYQGSLWAGGTGLWRWTPGPPKFYPVPGPAPAVYDLIEGGSDALWIATQDGIRQLVNGKVEASPVAAAGPFIPYRMLRDHDGGLWIASQGKGLVHIHQGRTDVFTSADGLSSDRVSSLFEDREGNIWDSTDGGLGRFRDLAVATISAKQGLSSPPVASVLAARDGSVWLGMADSVNRWDHGRVTIYRPPNASVQSLFQDSRGRVWASTPRGVAYFEDGRFVSVGSVPSTSVQAIAEESAGSLWISDQYLGLLHLLDGRLVEQIPWAKLGHKDPAVPVVVDKLHGGLWLGFLQGGVAYFKDGRIRASYTAADRLGEGRVNDLRFDRDGTLWAATEGGLSRLKNGRIATLTSKNGLPCDAVHWSIEDDAQSVWLMMPCGLARVARAELDAWAPVAKTTGATSGDGGATSGDGGATSGSESGTIHPTVFDSADGVRSLSQAGGYSPRVTKSADGKLWFTVGDGVSVIDPGHLPLNKLPPPVHIEQITADRKPVSPDSNGRLRLPPLLRELQIDYTALSFVAPEKMRFRYKLEGHDGEWTDAANRRQAFYNDLPPRNYRFRVMASNNDGVWNEAGASLDFSVEPAYYQTTWFRLSVVAAVLAMLAGLYRLRLLYLKQQFDIRFEERVNERMRLARDLHDTLLQSFQGVLLKFHAVTFALPDRPAEARESLESAIEQARAAVTEGRDAVQGLRSSTVVKNDLARAITTFGEGLASDQNGGHAPDFRVEVEGTSRDLAPVVRDEVYRIAGEALRNAFRHAGARRIEVGIHYEKWLLRVRVRDNGKGIDPHVVDAGGRAGHHGLPGMRERAELVGGKLAVWSEVNSGTEIELTIPSNIAYAKSLDAQPAASAGQPT